LNLVKRPIHKFGKWYTEKLCRTEYEHQEFLRRNERPIEFRFVFDQLARVCPTSVLDVGTGDTSLPHLIRTCGFVVTASDNVKDYWPEGMFNRHFHVKNDDITQTRLTEKFDFITCISVLEHIKDHSSAVGSMLSLLNPGGHLAITAPYNENKYLEDVYRLPGAGYGQDNPYVCQVYSRKEVDSWLAASGCQIAAQEYWQFFSGEFWTFGEQLCPPLQVDKTEKHQLTCLLIEKPSV
jgi:SAM-dependent methyltransferase